MTWGGLNVEAGMLSRSGTGKYAILGSCLFIAVIVNTSIGYVNKYAFNSYFGNVGQNFFWLVLGLSSVIILSSRKRYIHFGVLLIVFVVTSRSMIILLPVPEVVIAYKFAYSFLIMFASAVFFLKSKKVYEMWLKTFITINFVLLTLQLLGVSDVLHMWNTLFIVPGGTLRVELGPTLFVSSDALTVRFPQMRPPGLFYSAAITAGFLIMAVAHRIGGSISKFTTYDLILIASVFFLMAKISVLFLILFTVMRYFLCDANEKAARRTFLFAIPSLLLLQYILFPGVVTHCLTMDKFFVSTATRVADVLLFFEIEGIPIIGSDLRSELFLRLGMRYSDEGNIGSWSGIRFMVILLPLFLFWIIALKKRFNRGLIWDQASSRAKYLMMGFIFCFFATSTLGLTIFAFMLGPALTPFLSSSYNTRSPITERSNLDGELKEL